MAYHPFRHLGLKFLAIGLATLLWLTVSGERIVERGMRVPLGFENIPLDLEIVGEPPGAVDVRIRGSWGAVSMLAPGDVTAVLDLGTARPGSRLFHLGPEQVRAPFDVEVTQVAPTTIPLDLERSLSREVPVVPALDGKPAPGFEVRSATSIPESVEVIGPESELKRLTAATTEPVLIEGANSVVEDRVTVGVAGSALRLKSFATATVRVDIQPVRLERKFERVAVQPRGLQPKQRVTTVPRSVAITVRGPKGTVESLEISAIEAFVDLADLEPGRHDLPVDVELPENLEVLTINPPSVQVRIR